MTKEAKFILGIAGIVILGMLVLMAVSPSQSSMNIDLSRLVRPDSHMTGTTTAKVTIVEFGDYECPACAAANPVIDELIKVYATNTAVNIVYRNFPLSQHANAMISAEAAEAAGAQGKYWQMHDMLYARQGDWAESADPTNIFAGYAAELRLDLKKFKADLASHTYENFIRADENDGTFLNVAWTPSIYINGTLQKQIPTLDEFKAAINALLAR